MGSMEILLYIILICLLIIIVLQFWRSKRESVNFTPLESKLDSLQSSQERTDRSVREEIAQFRAEMKIGAHQERAELTVSLKSFSDSGPTARFAKRLRSSARK